MIAAFVVLALYRLEVISDVFKGSVNKKKKLSTERREADALGKALDVKAAELRAGRAAHRRVGPLQLELVRRLDAPNGVITLLAVNVGGRAKSASASAQPGSAHVNPSTIEPDDEVQITWSPGQAPETPESVTVSYVNAAGQTDTLDVRLDWDG